MVAVGNPLGIGPYILAPLFLLAGDVGAEYLTPSGTKASETDW